MKKAALAILACGIVALAFLMGKKRVGSVTPAPLPRSAPAVASQDDQKASVSTISSVPALARPPPPAPVDASTLSAEEKAARIEKIKRDYDEIRAKASTDYSAAGNAFPGGLNAFLRQLALLEREKRADFAAILSPRELEDLEMRETPAGQLVQKLLGHSAATEEQRRAVFRLQLEFEDRFALAFDITPAALLEREKARQVLQTGIAMALTRGADGAMHSELFAAWNEDYAEARSFAAQQGLPTQKAWQLWDAKNEFTVRRLELAANRNLTPDQRTAAMKLLVQQTESRVLNTVGAGAWQAARSDLLRWLPKS